MSASQPGEMDRRRFLGAVAALGLGGLALPGCNMGAAASSRREGLPRIGVQLYTVRDRMRQSVERTLQAVAEIGYDEVETHSFFDATPAQFRELLDRFGLVSPAGHVPITAIRSDLDATLAAAGTVGQRWVIVPWIEESERTPDGYRRVAEDLNAAARVAQERGLRVGYHNHEFEFEPLDGGVTGFEILLRETNPELVDIELDLFWAVKGGRDPLALFAAHPGRFRLCHVKDMQGIGGAERMVDVGQGEVDFAGIFAHGEQAGLRHFFVEHDQPEDSLESLRRSYDHLRQLTF
jgi:sugar phosphate isomerase/epimerase